MRPLVLRGTHGPVQLAFELLAVVDVDVVKHILVHHVRLQGRTNGGEGVSDQGYRGGAFSDRMSRIYFVMCFGSTLTLAPAIQH